MMIAQHQTDAASRPSMTNLTTKCAPQNIDHSEISVETEPRPWVITSVGFIGKGPFVLRPGPIRAASPGAQRTRLPEMAMATGSLRLSRLSHPGIRRNKGVVAIDAVAPGRFPDITSVKGSSGLTGRYRRHALPS